MAPQQKRKKVATDAIGAPPADAIGAPGIEVATDAIGAPPAAIRALPIEHGGVEIGAPPAATEVAAIRAPPAATEVGISAVVGVISRNLGDLQDRHGSYLSIYDEPALPLQDPVIDAVEAAVVGDDGFGNQSIVGVDEIQCEDFEGMFGLNAEEDDEFVSDGDSADDIWDDDRIPNPISSDDESESDVETVADTQPESPEEYMRLGKTFNCPEDFKIAILRYSLKTKYDIALYRSESLRMGAKCSDLNCQWRCYCSYDKKKKKMQIKVYVSEHSCVRSGYTKMLKQGRIAILLTERLRKNPKMTPVEMVEEIKREYNLTVTENQCAKAKTKVLKDKKTTHEEYFSRIWDYQAEIF